MTNNYYIFKTLLLYIGLLVAKGITKSITITIVTIEVVTPLITVVLSLFLFIL